MPAPLFANNAYSTLTTGYTSGATSLVLADSSTFPQPGAGQYTPAVIADPSTTPPTIKEYIYITANDGVQTITVTRAAEDSTRFPAAALTSGWAVAVVVTNGGLNDIEMLHYMGAW